MAQIDNSQQIHTLSLSDSDLLPILQANLSKIGILKSILHSSLLAIWKLSQENIVTFPCHQLLTFSYNSITNMQGLAAVNPKSMKELLTQIVTKTVLVSNQNLQKEPLEISTEQIYELFSLQIFNKILKQQFQKILLKILTTLKHQFNAKNVSNFIQIKWKSSLSQQLFQNNYQLVKKCGTIHKIIELTNDKPRNESNKEVKQQIKLTQFKQLLSKLSGNSKIKLDIYKIFQSNHLLLKQKQKQTQQWSQCSLQMKEIIKNQIKWIQLQQSENKNLQNTIEELRQQLKLNEDRFKNVQKQIEELEKQITSLKIPQPQTYYINPFYEREQLEQKMFMQMIQIQSELLLKKDQIKIMTDSIIEIVEKYQNSLQDLRASKYYKSKSNRSVYEILKQIKSFEAFDLQTMLNLKQESIYGSEYFEETRKSLSNLSQIETDVKQSRIFTEEDSLSGEQ